MNQTESVKELVDNIFLLEKEYEKKFTEAEEKYNQEYLRLKSDLNTRFMSEIEEYEKKLEEENRNLIEKYRKEVGKEYEEKLVEFEANLNKAKNKKSGLVDIIKRKVFSYGNK